MEKLIPALAAALSPALFSAPLSGQSLLKKAAGAAKKKVEEKIRT